MSLCAVCRSELTDGTFLCPHHHLAAEDHWAEGNRVLCALLHRGVTPRRLPMGERDNPAITEHYVP